MQKKFTYRSVFGLAFALGFLLIFLSACGPNDQRKALQYSGGGVNFSVRDVDGLYNIPMDSIPWVERLNYSSTNSPVAFFFYAPNDVRLSAPNIRVEFMSRNLDNCGSAQEVMDFWVNLFTVQNRGQVVTPIEDIKTYSGKPAKFLAIRIPEVVADSVTYPGKTMAWAYVESDTTLIGFNYTAQDAAKYEEGLPQFRDLIKTYEEK